MTESVSTQMVHNETFALTPASHGRATFPAGQDRLRNIREFVLISALAGAIVAAMALLCRHRRLHSATQTTMTFDFPQGTQGRATAAAHVHRVRKWNEIATLYSENQNRRSR